MGKEEKKYWIAISAFEEGIGPLRFKLLLEYFGSALAIWEAPERKLAEIGLGEKITAKFADFRKNFKIEEYLGQLDKKGIRTVILAEPDYPPLLKEISDPPPVLYLKGNFTDFNSPTLAVVGTRKSTNYGRQACEMLVSDLVSAGLVIVSGLARGIDSAAHQATLAIGGKTIAVLGCGVDVIYPPENKKLYEEITKSGVIVSEMPLTHWASKGTFPARNRIISGLSLGVLVVEGAEDSGALITASYAAEQGREVFAVPGPITSPFSAGPAKLLKSGAKLVFGAEDVLEELNLNLKFRKQKLKQEIKEHQELLPEERAILSLLLIENLYIDEIVRKIGLDSGKVGSFLSLMEIKGLVKHLGGGTYGHT